VIDLVTADTVNTMPEATLDAVRDHGAVQGDTIVPEYASAHAALDALTAAGIDLDDVVRVLEEEGVDKFVQSWNQLLDAVTKALADARAAAGR
jgi:transaldolase